MQFNREIGFYVIDNADSSPGVEIKEAFEIV